MNFINVEIIGIIAALFVLAPFVITGKERDIQIINIIGTLIFTLYGILIGALSIWILSGILFFIYIYRLYKTQKQDIYLKSINKSSSVFTHNNKEIERKK